MISNREPEQLELDLTGGSGGPRFDAPLRTGASAVQIGGEHYKQMDVEPWDAMEAWMTQEQFVGYLLGTALAYFARVNVTGVEGKGGLMDIKKGIHVLQKLVEVAEGA